MPSRIQVANYVADHLAEGREAAVRETAAWLVDSGRSREASYLARDVATVLAERGHLLAKVTTARAMDAPAKAAVEAFLRQTTGAKTLELQAEIDPSLIGGLKIDLPTSTLDASVQTKLDKFVEGMKGVTL